ncbi:hypothetical protein EJB05_28322, partial [Eragrostis curvula]
LELLAFLCNQFAGQEPGNNEEIQETACTRFKAEFPTFDKKDKEIKDIDRSSRIQMILQHIV